jgi:RNA polymerase sigma-70 factor (ECF subfamily)
MCYHSSRLDARTNENDEIILYQDQDENLWDHELIAKGNYFFKQASSWNIISKFYLEAGIAYWHTLKADTKGKWENILELYNHLLRLEYSPVAALNRTYALSKAKGKEVAILEANKLDMKDNHFYYILLGELYKQIDNRKAKEYFQKAFTLAKTHSEKQTIARKIENLDE